FDGIDDTTGVVEYIGVNSDSPVSRSLYDILSGPSRQHVGLHGHRTSLKMNRAAAAGAAVVPSGRRAWGSAVRRDAGSTAQEGSRAADSDGPAPCAAACALVVIDVITSTAARASDEWLELGSAVIRSATGTSCDLRSSDCVAGGTAVGLVARV